MAEGGGGTGAKADDSGTEVDSGSVLLSRAPKSTTSSGGKESKGKKELPEVTSRGIKPKKARVDDGRGGKEDEEKTTVDLTLSDSDEDVIDGVVEESQEDYSHIEESNETAEDGAATQGRNNGEEVDAEQDADRGNERDAEVDAGKDR